MNDYTLIRDSRCITALLKADSSTVQVDFFGESMEVGYFERFLRVLVPDTKYIAVVDEDVVIGDEFLALCVRALNTRKFYGVLGWHGRNFARPSTESDCKYLRGMRMVIDGRQVQEGGHMFGDEYGFVTPHPGEEYFGEHGIDLSSQRDGCSWLARKLALRQALQRLQVICSHPMCVVSKEGLDCYTTDMRFIPSISLPIRLVDHLDCCLL